MATVVVAKLLLCCDIICKIILTHKLLSYRQDLMFIDTAIMYIYSGTGLESKVCVRAAIGLFECISESNFGSPFAYVCSKPGVSFNTSMWMDHTNKP